MKFRFGNRQIKTSRADGNAALPSYSWNTEHFWFVSTSALFSASKLTWLSTFSSLSSSPVKTHAFWRYQIGIAHSTRMSGQTPPLPSPKHQLLQENPALASITQWFQFPHSSVFLPDAPVEFTVPASKAVRTHRAPGQERGLWQPHRWNNVSVLPSLGHPSLGSFAFRFPPSLFPLEAGMWSGRRRRQQPAGFARCWGCGVPGRSGASGSSDPWRNARF